MEAKVLTKACSIYGITVDDLQPLTGGHTTNVYGFTKDAREYVLRIIPQGKEYDLVALNAILAWMDYLAVHGCPVVKPIISGSGTRVNEISSISGTYLAIVVTKARGVLAETLSPEAWTDDLFHALGYTVGRMHALSTSYIPTFPESKRPDWNQAGNLFNSGATLDGRKNLVAQRDQTLQEIKKLSRSKQTWGMAHLDLHFANFFIDQEYHHVTLFDFDDCAYGWFTMDLALLLFDWCVLAPSQNTLQEGQRFWLSFLNGYLVEKKLQPTYANEVLLFINLLELNLYIMLAPAVQRGETDEWVKKFMATWEQRRPIYPRILNL